MSKYTEAKNPKYGQADNTVVILDVKFDDSDVFIGYVCSATDVVDYSVELFHRAVNGDFGEVQEYVEPEVTREMVLDDLNLHCSEYMYNHIVWDGHKIGSDIESKNLMKSYTVEDMVNGTETIYWERDVNDIFEIPIEEAKKIFSFMLGFHNICTKRRMELIAVINSVDDFQSVEFDGFPSNVVPD